MFFALPVNAKPYSQLISNKILHKDSISSQEKSKNKTIFQGDPTTKLNDSNEANRFLVFYWPIIKYRFSLIIKELKSYL